MALVDKEKKVKKTVEKAAPEKQNYEIQSGIDMNKAFYLRKEDAKPQWRLIDAQGQILGRLATELATILRGKDKAIYTPHTMSGDYIVIINADKVVLTGKKMEQKEYIRYSGWIGGKKTEIAKDIMAKHPDRILELAVKRMLPRNKLSDEAMRRLLIYAGNEHPHKAQIG
jgi:large subunit ribosomal protein L13